MWDKHHIPKLTIGDIWYSNNYSRDSGYRKVIAISYLSDNPEIPYYDYVKCTKAGKDYNTKSSIIAECIDTDIRVKIIKKRP